MLDLTYIESRCVKNGECLEWTGPRDRDGYGKYGKRGVHRLIYELSIGPIPEGLYVLHTCDHPWCINKDHLFLGTAQDNIDDCLKKNRFTTGTFHRDAKLNDLQVAMIRDLRSKGWTQQSLADMFAVSQPTISEIIRYKAWKHGSHLGVQS